MKFIIKLLLFICISLTSLQAAFEQERIKSYDSRIEVHQDGSMLVTETIKIHSEGISIKHGIYRDFPTDYKDEFGNNIRIKFNVVDILRDGSNEDFHTERLSNGVRVYIGSSDYILPHGDYTYKITYETDRQLGFFENYDELYWNVTGNGWGFNIDKVSANVILPDGIDPGKINFLAFTGRAGTRGKDYKAGIKANGQIEFTTTKRLFPAEGLTIVVKFPKGFVTEPDFSDRLNYFVDDNKSVIAIFIGIIILFLYYLFIWVRVGKDPNKGVIIPLYEPPADLSPAAVRFINRMGFDNKAFAAALINLCVKGILKLEEDGKDYKIIKTDSDVVQSVTKDELKLLSKLGFTRGTRKTLELKQKNHTLIRSGITGFKSSLKNTYEKIYFITNKKYFFTGIIISIFFLIISGLLSNEELLFSLIWNLAWGGGVAGLVYAVFKSWRTALAGRMKGAAIVSALFITLFTVPFVGGLILGMYFLSGAGSYFIVIGVILIILVNIIFHHLLKAPTRLGRKVMDQIDGFKMYLSVAEKDRLNSIKQPEKTPELFEKFLPYAIALDVENEWGKKFESVLEKAAADGSRYSPAWYDGHFLSSVGAASIASSIGSSLTSTISSSSTAPGSSSGSSGGSSGGGGGGGGGGGW